MTICRFDTCDCVIEYNERVIWISTIQTCRLHKSLNGQNLLDSVQEQNRRFNFVFGKTLTEAEEELIIQSKEVNKLRIRKESLVNYHEHLADHHDLSFLENLKRLLR